MNKELQLKKRLEEGRLKIINAERICFFPGCSNPAIGSHVLQEKGILNAIVDSTNHFYSIRHVPAFHMNPEKVFTIKRTGINEGYKFQGFCNEHDSKIFLPIETHPINLFDKRSQALFIYRTICLELRKQEIYLEINQDRFKAMFEIEPDKKNAIIMQPAEYAVKDMKFYKKEIEDFLFHNTENNFNTELIELPENKICFSAAISIDDPTNNLTSDIDEYGYPNEHPLAISILNYFPYQGNSYLITAYHKTYFCNWTKSLSIGLNDKEMQGKIISDILTYRLDFWGISPEFYESLSEDKRDQFLKESHMHSGNFDINIRTDFNLFS